MSKNKKVPETLNSETVVSNPEIAAAPLSELDQAKADAKALQAKIKELKAKESGSKAPRVNKGIHISFVNKSGETISGLGVLYYVTRSGGKLHYKEASAVHILTAEEIKELEALS